MSTPNDPPPAIVARFAAAWQRGERPLLDEYLALAGAAEQPRVLREMVRIDLERRLQAGEGVRVEDYLRRYPGLRGERETVVELIVREYELRRRSEPHLPLSAYHERFPEYVAELSLRLQVTPLPIPTAMSGNGQPPVPLPTQPLAVPGYEVLGELGRGGMGVVYRARQVSLNRLVALKMILAGSLASADARQRFRSEAEAVARLQHPHIVQIYDVGEHEGRPYFSLEYVAGGSLAARLRGRPLPPGEAVPLVRTMAQAIQHAHQHRIVHRDLKPANVLLAEDGTPKISDFGLAKHLDATAQTPSGAILGTPSYMAPEQAGAAHRQTGSRTPVGPAADVYALGAILYELLTGRPPFLAETTVDTLLEVLTAEPVPPRRLQPTIPPDLETICLKCLRKSPARRYGSAAELDLDLERWQKGEPVRARPPSLGYVAGKFLRRHWPAAALALVLLLGVLGGIAAVFYALGSARTPPLPVAPVPTARSTQDAYQRTLDATGWVVIQTPAGTATGTCTLVDGPRRLALTARHVADANDSLLVFFPIRQDGKLVTDHNLYLTQFKDRAIPGRVVARELQSELGLLQLDSLPPGVVPLPWASRPPAPGDSVHTVSNPGDGSLWSYAANAVQQVYLKDWQTKEGGKLLSHKVTVVETPWMTGLGAGGAPLVNNNDELAGIAIGLATAPMPLNFFTEASEARAFVEKYLREQQDGEK
jgi:S1-C subfamily serine protease